MHRNHRTARPRGTGQTGDPMTGGRKSRAVPRWGVADACSVQDRPHAPNGVSVECGRCPPPLCSLLPIFTPTPPYPIPPTPPPPLLGAADLHTPSTVSDATAPPAALVHQAAAAGLWGIALTDHDSTAGWDNAATAARDAGIAFIPGIELSTRLNGVSVHVLGYLIDPDSAQLRAELVTIRDSRLQRAERIVTRIARDYDLTWEDVLAQSGVGSTIGRPHIADA